MNAKRYNRLLDEGMKWGWLRRSGMSWYYIPDREIPKISPEAFGRWLRQLTGDAHATLVDLLDEASCSLWRRAVEGKNDEDTDG